MPEALDIGLEIKVLRERLKLSSKDLAAKIGLSQSQMSRLEKGQRRIDTTILHRISEALGVDPSFFFREASSTPAPAEAPAVVPTLHPRVRFEEIGKLVRSERRKRHLTVDDLAQKVGKTKAFLAAFEEGKHPLDGELATRLTRALKLPAGFFVETQQEILRTLEARVARLDRALAEALRAPEAPGSTPGIPLLGLLSDGQPFLFDERGRPVGEPEDFLVVPGFQDAESFAFTISGESMQTETGPSFSEGDLVVFSPATISRSRDLALVRLGDDTLIFRKLFFESDGSVRLQPLNLDHAARQVPRKEIAGTWRVALHVGRR